MISYIFRKRSPTVFSIERLFNTLYKYLAASGVKLQRLELPYVSTGVVSVLKNAWFVAGCRKKGLLQITGDVHYAALLCIFSKTVITVHDCVALHRRRGFRRFVMRILWFWLPLRLCTAIVAISEHTKHEILNAVSIPEKKIVVIPNFFDPMFAFSPRPFFKERPRILHIGTTPNKNLPRVIQALKNISCVLVIVGELSRLTLKSLEQAGVQYENFVGIDDARMLGLYQDADIISFPTTYEGFGMPVIEGQAVGRPVLTSDLEPMRSVAGPNGALLVAPESVDELHRAFNSLINDAGLRAALVAAGQSNCRRFTLQSVAARYLDLYESLNYR